jgi:hypothetical protein
VQFTDPERQLPFSPMLVLAFGIEQVHRMAIDRLQGFRSRARYRQK